MYIYYIFIFLLGLIFGSFFNVLIYRLPRKESISFPPSYCPNCKSKIKWYDNIPVFSYIILRGKCRNCKKRISPIYPFVEMLSAIMFILLFIDLGLSIAFIVFLIDFSLLLILSFIDLRYKEINIYYLIIPFILSFLFVFLKNYNYIVYTKYSISFIDNILGLFIGAGLFWFIRFIGSKIMKREAMGEADIYIMGFGGFLIGIKLIFACIIIAGISGIVFYMFYRIIKKDAEIPFIPFLSLGIFLSFLFRDYLIRFYTI